MSDKTELKNIPLFLSTIGSNDTFIGTHNNGDGTNTDYRYRFSSLNGFRTQGGIYHILLSAPVTEITIPHGITAFLPVRAQIWADDSAARNFLNSMFDVYIPSVDVNSVNFKIKFITPTPSSVDCYINFQLYER